MSDTLKMCKVAATGRKTKRVYITKAVAEHLVVLGRDYSASMLVKSSSVSKSVAGSTLTTKAVTKKSSDGQQSYVKTRTGYVKKLRAV